MELRGELVLVAVPRDIWPRRSEWRGRVVDVAEVGATVERGDVVAEVEVEKAVLEIESPVSGVVAEVYVGRGDEVGPGDGLLAIRPREGAAEGQA